MKFYRPYPKQREFHDLGGQGKTFRLFFAGNQLGKSECGASELAMHLTGQYPDWWKGITFNHPVLAWAGGDTNVTVRDILQEKLFGSIKEPGTGFIPEDCIGDATKSHNIRNSYERCEVKHVTGGISTVVFKSYEQGEKKWRGVGVHVIHLDEEPDPLIWAEAIARVSRTGGIIMKTFTPSRGTSAVVKEFYPTPNSDEKAYVRMTLDDAQHEDGTSHMTPEEREKQRTRFPEYMRDARLRGLPQLGEGLIYPIDHERLLEPFCTPGKHWRHIGGLDLGGGSSPTAWAWLALDPVVGCWHLLHTYKHVDPRISVHASSMVTASRELPFAWPHDAASKTHHGTTKVWEYRSAGVRMLEKSSRFPAAMGGGNHVEDGISFIYNLMENGMFKAAGHLTDFWDELRSYHRVQGQVNKIDDHILDAIRYAMMNCNYARPIGKGFKLPRRMQGRYDPLHQDRYRRKITNQFASRDHKPNAILDEFGEEDDNEYPTRMN